MIDISFEHLTELSSESTAESYKTKRLLRNAYILDVHTSVKCRHTCITRNRMWNTYKYATFGLVVSMVSKVGLR